MPDLLTILVIVLVLLLVFGDSDDESAETAIDPYSESLDAASRISAMAFEAEQLMHRAAAQAETEEEETL